MPSHHWNDDRVDFRGIGDAADYIGSWLRRWFRVPVSTTKEKFGTARVYCYFGWTQLFSITHPGYAYSRYPQWLWHLDCMYLSRIVCKLNRFIVPIHRWAYRFRYRQAIRKWPHLAGEILCGADHVELLLGLDPNLHYEKKAENYYQYWWTGYTGGRTDWTGGIHDPEKEEEEVEADDLVAEAPATPKTTPLT